MKKAPQKTFDSLTREQEFFAELFFKKATAFYRPLAEPGYFRHQQPQVSEWRDFRPVGPNNHMAGANLPADEIKDR